MELLLIRDNTPYKDKRNSSVEFLRDKCFLYLDDNLRWQFLLNGEGFKGENYGKLYQIINDLIIEKEKHHRSDTQRRLVIWTNQLSLFVPYIKTLQDNLTEIYAQREIKGKNTLIIERVENKDLEFRNFDFIAGETIDEVNKTWNLKKKGVYIMEAFINKREEQGLYGWNSIRYSFANNNLKIFYKNFNEDICKELFRENVNRTPSKEVFDVFINSCKRGLMWYDESRQGLILNNVYSHDIRSAYDSQFVRGNDFPLGTIRRVSNDCLLELYANSEWFHLVMISDEEVKGLPEFINYYQQPNDSHYYYSIGCYDYKIIRELLGLSLSSYSTKWKKHKLFVCDKTGYLNYDFRKEVVKQYNKRQALKLKNDPEERIIKQITKDIYGKGIQKRNLDTERIRTLYKNKTYYICAQISYHALQRTRYELMLMACRLGWDVVAADTDSIKTQHPLATQFFNERNKEISEENKLAGFPNTLIGTWKLEYIAPRFIQLRNKVYAYEKNNELTTVFSGCLKEKSQAFFSKLTLDESFAALLREDLIIPEGVVQKSLVWEDGFKVKRKYYDYTLRRNSND